MALAPHAAPAPVMKGEAREPNSARLRGAMTMVMDQPSAFGDLLKQYRMARGLTQIALADRARLSVRGISDIERGVHRAPQTETVRRLSDALRLSPQERAALDAAIQRFRVLSASSSSVLPSSAALCPASPTRCAGCLAASSPLQASGASSPPFVGRADELALVRGHIAGVGPPLLVLEGEPGIGKSRLLEEAGVCARDMGARALTGGCRRGGGQEPYAPLPDILERHIYRQAPGRLRVDFRGCAWLVRLLPALAEGLVEPLPDWTLTAGQERRLIANALARFLVNVAGPAGTMITLDDLQWITPDALDLLVTLVQSPGAPRVRVVGAYRGTDARPHDPLSDVLADLARAGLVTHRTLGPLSPGDTTRLLDHLLEGVDGVAPSLRARVLQRAGGAPFFVVSWARGVRAHARDGVWAWSVPWDLRPSIRQRVAVLPEAARELLGVAAVADRAASRALLFGLTTQPEGAAVAALDAALRARLLEEDGAEGYRFAHDVIRDVVMLLPRLAWAHLDLGDVSTAETIAAQAATRARTTANRLALMDALRVQALVQIRRRHWAEAEQAVEEALARDMRHPYGEARVLHAYGDLHHAKGESGRARECWEAARVIFQRLGARAEAARVDMTIAAA